MSKWLTVIFVCLWVLPALANGPSIGFSAGGIFPVRNDSVRLKSEWVRVQLKGAMEDGEALCKYELVNLTDSLQVFHMAFFSFQFHAVQDFMPEWVRNLNFRVLADGAKLPVTFEEIDIATWDPYARTRVLTLPVWTVSIAPKSTAHLEMTYAVRWGGDSGDWDFSYEARPAALWAGRLEQARVEFEVDPLLWAFLDQASPPESCLPVVILPAGWRLGDSGPIWEFYDWEPDATFEIRIRERIPRTEE